VQTDADVRPEWFDAAKVVGLTAGTSTPDDVIDRVEARIRLCEDASAGQVRLCADATAGQIRQAGAPAARTLRGGVEAGAPAARTLRGGVEVESQIEAKPRRVERLSEGLR
jgi:LytB protein